MVCSFDQTVSLDGLEEGKIAATACGMKVVTNKSNALGPVKRLGCGDHCMVLG